MSTPNHIRPTVASRRRLAVCTVIVSIVVLTGCAAFDPPLQSTSTGDDPLEITALRAGPDGLELGLRDAEASVGDSLEIWQGEPDDEWTRLQTITVDDDLLAPLRNGRAEWHVALDNDSRQLEYRIRRPDDEATSPPLAVDWHGWPDAPMPSTAIVDEPSIRVELRWDDAIDLEARILRRDVLADTDFAPRAIVDSSARGRFEDHDVEPGGVYAYQVQYVDRRGPFPRFSRYTEAVYVSVPEP